MLKKTIQTHKTARLDDWQGVMKGIAPNLSYEFVRQTPKPDLIKTIRDYICSGLRSQQAIAKDIGLSRTKMSQFMNNAKRVRGWTEVEKRLDQWIKDFNNSKRVRTRHLENLYKSKPGKPQRPVVENAYKRSKLSPDCGRNLDPQHEIVTSMNACTTSTITMLFKRSPEVKDCKYDFMGSPLSEHSEGRYPCISFEQDDGWSSFEISKVLDM